MLLPGDTLTISEAIRQLAMKGYEISDSQIRKLDRMGLLSLKKEEGKQREVTAHAMMQLEIILYLRFVGVPLKSIKSFLQLYDLFKQEHDEMEELGYPCLEDQAQSSDYPFRFPPRDYRGLRRQYRESVEEIIQKYEMRKMNMDRVGKSLKNILLSSAWEREYLK